MGLLDKLSNGVGKAASAVNPISGMKDELHGAAAQASEQITLFANLTLILLFIIAVSTATLAFFAVRDYWKSRK